MPDYIPSADAAYDEWLRTFTSFIVASGTSYGLDAAQVADMQAAQTAWEGAYQGHLTARNSAQAAVRAKEVEREESETLARQLTRIMQAFPATTDMARAAAGITVPDINPTPEGENVVEQTTPPLVVLDWSQRERVTVHFGPNPGNERNNGLPAGIRGAKLWYAVGGIPATDDGWRYLVDDTRSPYVHVLTLTEPTTVAYRAQYFDRKMRVGPFGDPVQATVTL